MTSALALILTTLLQFISIYIALIIVRILLTWFPMVGWMQQIASFLSIVTDPYLNLFRNIVPPMGGFDFSTILAVLVLQLVQSALQTFAPYLLASMSLG
jgi:YggT family protein